MTKLHARFVIVTTLLFASLVWSIPGTASADQPGDSRIVGAVPAVSAARGVVETYEVQQGDNLGSIAELLGVDVSTLQSLNNIADPNAIKAGMVLVVPDVPTRAAVAGTPLPKPKTDPNAPDFVWPAVGPITTRFGVPGSDWVGGFHMGLDIGAPAGSPIVAAADGVVESTGFDRVHGYGNFVLIYHHDSYETLYGHMSQTAAQEGQAVRQGDVIGYVGMTGFATGPHLHFEVRLHETKIDPQPFLP